MSVLTKTTDKTLVTGSESFIYTFQVSYSGLTTPAQNGELTDFFPSKIIYTLPDIEDPIQNILQTPVAGGTLVTFQFGEVDAGTSFSFTVACKFGPGRVNNDTFINTGTLYADDEIVSESSAPLVTLKLIEGFELLKELLSPIQPVHPGQELQFRLSLTNTKDAGASIQNIDITDVLPDELIPVTNFLPVGNDIPSGGYTDPTYNGRTGTWNGQTMNFTLPSFHGVRYEILFKATVSETVSPGKSFTNTAVWTVDNNSRPNTSIIINVFDEDDIFGLQKSGNRTGAVGKPIFYSMINRNQDTTILNNYKLTDTLPNEVDITFLTFTSVVESIPSYSIYITVSSLATRIPILTNHSGDTGSIDFAPFIPAGERVTTVEIDAPTLQVSDAAHSLHLYGFVNQTATPLETIRNTATAVSDTASKTVFYDTLLNGASDLTSQKGIIPQQASYSPLEEFKFILATGPINTFTIEPIFADLLPNSIHYVTDSEYFIYIENSTGITYDSRMPNFPIPLPERVIIDNFDNTGQTLIRWSFIDYTLPMNDVIQIFFTCFVKITPPGTFTNNVFIGNPGKDVLFVYTAVPDTRDYDGDGITDELISGAETTGVILTTSEFSIKKLVKGDFDLEYKTFGTTTANGNLSYQLLITNNQDIDLKDIELVDIFPYIGDTGVILTDTPRDSEFYVYPTASITAEIINIMGLPVPENPAITIWYSTSNNPVRFDSTGNTIGTGTFSLTPPLDVTTIRSIKVTTGEDTILHPYDRLIITINSKTPANVPIGQIAYNSFAVRANQILGDMIEPLLPTEPNKVGIQIAAPLGGSIGQFVWEDLNQNGLYDVGEPGVNGITVQLYNENMELIASTVTSNNQAMQPGYYSFNNLSPGNYFVKFIPKRTCQLTFQRESLPNGSKPNEFTGFTSIISLAADQHRTDINAGVICQCNKNPYAQAVTDLVTSVALEQTGLSHILNAEGEKIQKAVSMNLTQQELLKINCSVENMIHSISQLEMILSDKLSLFSCIICDNTDC